MTRSETSSSRKAQQAAIEPERVGVKVGEKVGGPVGDEVSIKVTQKETRQGILALMSRNPSITIPSIAKAL